VCDQQTPHRLFRPIEKWTHPLALGELIEYMGTKKMTNECHVA